MTCPVDAWYTTKVPRDYPRLLTRAKRPHEGTSTGKELTELGLPLKEEMGQPLHAPGFDRQTLCGRGRKLYVGNQTYHGKDVVMAAGLGYVNCKKCLRMLKEPWVIPAYKDNEAFQDVNGGWIDHRTWLDQVKLVEGIVKQTGNERIHELNYSINFPKDTITEGLKQQRARESKRRYEETKRKRG